MAAQTSLQAPNTNGAFANRYVLLSKIGQGGMGAVYRAEDRLTGDILALKRVEQPAARLLKPGTTSMIDTTRRITEMQSPDQVALINEFRILASLRHPNIVSVIDYGIVNGQTPFFTMDLLEAPQDIASAAQHVDFRERVRQLIELLHALVYLHRHHIIHADLKPSNVLVDMHRRVRVVDFGLSQNASYTTATMGSLPYMAPEVLLGAPITEAADLYSFGLIAYECFTDSYPFDWSDQDMLVDQIKHLPVNMDSVQYNANFPTAAILERLLNKRAEERYENAAVLIPLLSQAADLPIPIESITVRESYLQSAQFVGREVQLQLLSQSLHDARTGRGSAWLIGGESGVGKSRLLEEIRIRGLVDGFQVVRAQATSHPEPNQLWRDTLPLLILNTDFSEIEAALLKAVVPHIDTLLRQDVKDAPILEFHDENLQDRLGQVVRALFARQDMPVLLLIDDIHWAESSLPLLKRLVRDCAKLPLLIVGTYRSDEYPQFPARLPDMYPMQLERFSVTEIAELASAILGDVSSQPQLLALLQSETEGNALFLIEVLRALSEDAGMLQNIGKLDLPTHVFPRGIREVVERRLNRLPTEYHEMLRFAAVLGRIIDPLLLRHINPMLDFERWLSHCLDASIIEIVWEQWQFSHDKIREGVLDSVSEQLHPFLHWRAAEAIEAVYGSSDDYAGALAAHWRIADNLEKEAHYTAILAQQLINTSAYHEARIILQRTYDRLLDHTAPYTQVSTARLQKLIGDTHSFIGQYDVAQEWYRDSLKLARQVREDKLVAEVSIGLGRVLSIQLGDFEAAELLLVSALRLYEDLYDQYGIANALFELGRVAFNRQRLNAANDYFERCLTLRYQLQDDLGVARTLERIGRVALVHRQLYSATQCLVEARAIHQRIGNLQGLAQTLSTLGMIARENSQFTESLELFKQAAELATRIGDNNLLSVMLNHLASTSAKITDYQAALSYYEQSLDIARRTNNKLLLAKLAASVGILQINMGNLKEARNNLYEWLTLVHEIGAEQVVDGLIGWAHLALLENKEGSREQAVLWINMYDIRTSQWDQTLAGKTARAAIGKFLSADELEKAYQYSKEKVLSVEISKILRSFEI